MAYSQRVTKDLRVVSKCCFGCNRQFRFGDYKAIHSGTGLHLELVEVELPAKYAYKVTSPPDEYLYLMAEVLPVNKYGVFGFRYWADAVCVCNRCHIAIHALALRLSRSSIPAFSGNTPPPWLLAEATFNFNLYETIPVY